VAEGSDTPSIWREQVIGPDYPDDVEHISFATPMELRALADALDLREGDHLVDLACGAGGSGLWMAQTTRALLTGVDFSAVGVELARQRADRLGMANQARFTRGSFSDTGLPADSMDAAMTLDALQYAPNKLAAMQEAYRILKPGGRFGGYTFVLDANRVASMPGAWEDPVEDYRQPMEAAGFDVVRYESTDGWLEHLTDAYSAVISARDTLLLEIGERATNALLFEMTLTLERQPYRDRVFAVGRKP
jgi:ubiquinone/menaquinone biosynthesis C-methylase UbiE